MISTVVLTQSNEESSYSEAEREIFLLPATKFVLSVILVGSRGNWEKELSFVLGEIGKSPYNSEALCVSGGLSKR